MSLSSCTLFTELYATVEKHEGMHELLRAAAAAAVVVLLYTKDERHNQNEESPCQQNKI